MPTMTFRGAFIRGADLRFKEEAGKFCRIHITADWSTTVRDRMGWSDFQDKVTSAKLDGELTAHNIILTPTDKELRKYELQIECSEISDFQIFRVKDGDARSHVELRFAARSNQADAMALIESYVGTAGQCSAQLRVTHDKQEGLDFKEETEDAQGSLPIAATETEPAAGETKEPALASVAVMPDIEERRKKRQMRRGEKPLGTPVDHAAKPSGVTDEDWNREQKEDPNVPHHLAEVVQ